jgi:hypothetical protein
VPRRLLEERREPIRPTVSCVVGEIARDPSERSKEAGMAIVVKFEVKGSTAAKYEEVIKRLEAVGMLIPPGQLYHVCYGSPDDLQVINIFDSVESLEAFGQTLGPILGDLGISATPNIEPVYRIIEG